MAEPKAVVDTPPGEPKAEEPPVTVTPVDDPAAAPETPPAAPPATPAQKGDEPPPEEPPALTDEQIMQGLRDPRSQAILQYAYNQQDGAGAPAAPVDGSPPAAPAPSGDGDFLTGLAKMAEEGDVSGVQTAVAAESARANAATAATAAEGKAVDTARRQTLASLADVEELKNLNASQQLRLIQALQKGDGAFVREAGFVIAENQRGASQESSAAQAEAAGATARAPGTPDLPAASPAVSGPPIPEGEEAKHKSGYEVLNEFFTWEDEGKG